MFRLLLTGTRYVVACVLLPGTCQLSYGDTFATDIKPILERRCVRCHGPGEQNGNVRFDTLSPDLINNPADAETWHDALNAINLGEMPPADEPQLTKSERTTLVDWLTREVERAIRERRGTGGQVVMRRLNRVEYQNTMRDLLGIDLHYARNLPPDAMSEDGFRNNGAALRMTGMQLEYYLESARLGLSRAIVEGPAPPVWEHHAAESVADKGKGNWTNRLDETGVFVARIPEFPDEGEFLIRIRARAELADGAPFPQMQVTLGYRADTQTPSRVVDIVDVTAEMAQEFEFRGRIEEFPLQSRTQSKYPGLLIWIRNGHGRSSPTPSDDSGFPVIVIESLEFVAPVYQAWPPEHHTRILPNPPGPTAQEELNATEACLREFMLRAHRRPPADDTVHALLEFFTSVRSTVDSFEDAVRETLAMVLISPDFLYRVEPSGDPGRPLDGYELASRLSYFLWNSMPDDRLFQLAHDDVLTDPDVLAGEVSRMLADRKSWSFVEEFSDQWLDLAGVNRVAINPNYYPEFDTDLKVDMRRETQHFFAEVLHKDLSAIHFLQSDFAMLNHQLARHYGVDGPRGSTFERVALPTDSKRGGLLTQAAILLANSTGEDSHPIERGVWLRTALLNDPPAPPPPNVPNLEVEGVDAALLPVREQLELHRENEACAHCHERIDPWGIPFEEFDAIGLHRTSILRTSGRRRKQTHPVDASTILPDGRAVDGIDELQAYLVEHQSRQFAKALASKLLTYALGRSLELADAETVERLTAEFIENDYRLQTLVHSVVSSEPFLSR